MPAAYLSLGTNVGNRLQNLRRALELLGDEPRISVEKKSSVYETAPVGGPAQPDFYNMAVEISTELPPERLLDVAKTIERKLGRKSGRGRGPRWGPRPLDIDILLYNAVIQSDPALTIPHPRLRERAFVLVPLLEIAPELRLPGGKKLKDLLESVADQPVRRIGASS